MIINLESSKLERKFALLVLGVDMEGANWKCSGIRRGVTPLPIIVAIKSVVISSYFIKNVVTTFAVHWGFDFPSACNASLRRSV